MILKWGITGNYYVIGKRADIVEVCEQIDKSERSIYYSRKFKRWAIRVKNKRQKALLKEIFNIK